MFAYLSTIQSKTCVKTPLRKVRQRFSDLKKPIESVAELKQPIQRGRLLLLGNSNAGKTSTMKSLMGEPFNPFGDNTCGVDMRLVDHKWKEISDSTKACCAPVVEAKFVAEGAMKDRDEMQEERRTTHGVYRDVLNFFYEKLEPYIGSSTCAKAPTFYVFVFFLVAVLGLWQTAAVDAFVFLVLELHRDVKVKDVDWRVWLFVMYGLCIGIGIGKVLIVTFSNLNPFSTSFGNEIRLALILIGVAEFLMMSKKLIIAIPVGLRSILDILDIPTDSAKIVHFCITGMALKLCFSGRWKPFFYGFIFLAIFVLQCGYLRSVRFASSLRARLFLLLEFILVCYHFKEVTLESVICFFAVDLFIHAAASCHNARTKLNREGQSLIAFIGELMNPSKPLSKANKLLSDPDHFQHEIEAIQSMRIQLLDFAGDEAYYCYHHIFLVDNAINLVVFDCSLVTGGGSELVHRQMKSIWFWLESISIQTQQNNCVFLVATHCYGKSKHDLEKVDKLLNSNFYETFAEKFVFNTKDGFVFFPVENSNGPKDFGICVLREAVNIVADELFDEQVQLSCFKLEDKISELRKSEGKAGLCLAVDEFKALSKSCGFEEIEADRVINYLYNQGIVLYAREDPQKEPRGIKWVLLQPQHLVDVIIKLVEHCKIKNPEAGPRRDWELLRKRGYLTRKLFCHILSPFDNKVEGIKLFLEDFNIICSVEDSIQPVCKPDQVNITHFVPAKLPEKQPYSPTHCNEKTFYVFFKRFLPEAAFYALMAHAYKQSTHLCPDDRLEMKRGYGLFWLMLAPGHSHQMCYELTLMKDDGVIKVTFNMSHLGGRVRPGDVLVQVAEMMNSVCQTSFKHLEFLCGPACPSNTCPGDQPTSSSYLSYHRSQPRPHVFNVYPRCKREMNVVSFNCRERCFVGELREWLPS